MLGLFLQTADYALKGASSDALLGGLFALLAAMFLVFLILGIAFYIYSSLAFMAIGRKARDSLPGLAWIPGIGPVIIAFRASKMHWWPWLLLLSILLSFIPILGIVIYFLGMIAFMVFVFIWNWKLFEAVGRPGWWALMPIVPILGTIAYLIVIGIAAWGKK